VRAENPARPETEAVANNAILHFYERAAKENGPADRRLRIEHAQYLLKSDIPRFAALRVIASMQPYQLHANQPA
jgi:predicted amidohydrolase YtcJ